MKMGSRAILFATLASIGVNLVSAMVVKDTASAQVITTATANVYRANEYGVYSHGIITFTQVKDDGNLHVRMRGRLKSIEPMNQDHAFIIHDGPASWVDGCSKLGGHFNPHKTQHGAPNEAASQRHVGDLGNIFVDRFGFAEINTNDDLIQVGTSDAKFDILGKTLAIHYLPDDFGRGGNLTRSLGVGDYGAIIACGNIEVKTSTSSSIFASAILLISCVLAAAFLFVF